MQSLKPASFTRAVALRLVILSLSEASTYTMGMTMFIERVLALSLRDIPPIKALVNNIIYLRRNYIVVDVSVQASSVHLSDHVDTDFTPRYDERYSGGICAAA
jgi:hypothetical protein